MDVKGISIFLVLTYGVGYALAWGGLSLGLISFEGGSLLHSLIMVLLLNLPAVFAFLAGQLGNGGGPVIARVTPVPRVSVLRVVVMTMLIFAAFNLIAAGFKLTVLDWRMGALVNTLQDKDHPLQPNVAAVLPAFLLIAGMLTTMVLGASLVAVCVLGHVYAWHTFLQNRLAPLGRLRSIVVGGVLWALWFAPFAYAHLGASGLLDGTINYGKFAFLPVGGVIVAIALTSTIRTGFERSGSLALPAVILGSFIAHTSNGSLAIWNYVFQIETPPWTGVFGVISALLWIGNGLAPGMLVGGTSPAQNDAPVPQTQPHEA